MRQILVILSAVLPMISFGAALKTTPENIAPFVGSYLGAGAGLNMQFFKNAFLEEGTLHWINFGNDGLSGHLHGGLNYGFNPNSMLGFDVHAQYNGTSPSKHRHNNILAFSSFQLPWQFGLSAKVGHVYKNNLFYLLAGPEWVQFKNKSVADSGASASINQYQFGGLFGFGLSQNIFPNLNIVEQFSYGIFQGATSTLSNGDTSTTNNPSDATVMLALEYHF